MSNETKNIEQEEVEEKLEDKVCEEEQTNSEEKIEKEVLETVSKKQFDEINDKFIRLAAEYDNFRKRSQRERESVHSDAVSFAVKALLPTYDNLERALKVETADCEYKKGVEMTMTQLVDSFKSIGVEKIDCKIGDEFNPNIHNAVMHVENEEFGENTVCDIFQQGFKIGEKVIRHAMVQVAN